MCSSFSVGDCNAAGGDTFESDTAKGSFNIATIVNFDTSGTDGDKITIIPFTA